MAVRVITFHYTLTDPHGNQLDSSQGGQPMSFIEGVGQKRSRRYRLTRAGREHCERLLESLLESASGALAAEEPRANEEAEAARQSPKPWCDWLES